MQTRFAKMITPVFKTVALPLTMVFTGCVPAALSVNEQTFDARSRAPSHSLSDEQFVQSLQTAPAVNVAGKRDTTVQTAAKRTARDDQPETSLVSKDETTMTTVHAKTATTGKVQHANTANFQQQVIESDVPVLVDFYADWCGPCRMLAPTLDKLAKETPDAKVVKVNIDDSQELALKYRVSSIPALMVFKDGSVVAQHSGLADKATLQRLLGG
jgi:thioredoxin 1